MMLSKSERGSSSVLELIHCYYSKWRVQVWAPSVVVDRNHLNFLKEKAGLKFRDAKWLIKGVQSPQSLTGGKEGREAPVFSPELRESVLVAQTPSSQWCHLDTLCCLPSGITLVPLGCVSQDPGSFICSTGSILESWCHAKCEWGARTFHIS